MKITMQELKDVKLFLTWPRYVVCQSTSYLSLTLVTLGKSLHRYQSCFFVVTNFKILQSSLLDLSSNLT